MQVFIGVDDSVLEIQDNGDILIYYDKSVTEGTTLRDLTDMDFDDAMYVRGLTYSGVYALDLYRIKMTDIVPANYLMYSNLMNDMKDYYAHYKTQQLMLSKMYDGEPCDYKVLLPVQKEMRSLSKRIKKTVMAVRQFVYKVVPRRKI